MRTLPNQMYIMKQLSKGNIISTIHSLELEVDSVVVFLAFYRIFTTIQKTLGYVSFFRLYEKPIFLLSSAIISTSLPLYSPFST